MRRNPHLLIPHYLMHAFLYYERDSPVVSDEVFNEICRGLEARWDSLVHHHKALIDRECLRADTGFYLSGKYPTRTIGAAEALLRRKPWITRRKPKASH